MNSVKEKGGKPDRKPHPFPIVSEIYTETSSLITLKIMPRQKPQRNCTFMNSALGKEDYFF
jgi:hypothetical protein